MKKIVFMAMLALTSSTTMRASAADSSIQTENVLQLPTTPHQPMTADASYMTLRRLRSIIEYLLKLSSKLDTCSLFQYFD